MKGRSDGLRGLQDQSGPGYEAAEDFGPALDGAQEIKGLGELRYVVEQTVALRTSSHDWPSLGKAAPNSAVSPPPRPAA
ncbi:hypothetical protein SHKM778_73620 [Streptomyces sp. KM77-8]|uniref:Uncharacterized protein n=1 Tax=Streptomyces haneummycinicus TaxID=3074435 RepID=A0AAT9HTR7_9ACTN